MLASRKFFNFPIDSKGIWWRHTIAGRLSLVCSLSSNLECQAHCRLELPKEEATQNLRFERAAAGKNFAIVLSHVEPGSQCEQVQSHPTLRINVTGESEIIIKSNHDKALHGLCQCDSNNLRVQSWFIDMYVLHKHPHNANEIKARFNSTNCGTYTKTSNVHDQPEASLSSFQDVSPITWHSSIGTVYQLRRSEYKPPSCLDWPKPNCYEVTNGIRHNLSNLCAGLTITSRAQVQCTVLEDIFLVWMRSS